jgi:FtsP/CotA-like multicopper oxidase with cupredoxin domain
MSTRASRIAVRLVLAVAAGSLGFAQGGHAQELVRKSLKSDGSDPQVGQMRSTTAAQRKAARSRQAPQKTGVSQNFAGVDKATAAISPLAIKANALATMAAPLSQPDYFGVANWANSPLPTNLATVVPASATAAVDTTIGSATFGQVTSITLGTGGSGYIYPYVSFSGGGGTGAFATAAETGGVITAITLVNGGSGYTSAPTVTISGVTPGTGMRKFVDLLPGLCGVSPWHDPAKPLGTNGLGQCIPIATKFATPPAGVPNDADYYEIGLNDYSKQLHSDLPVTKLRGYKDLNPASLYPGNQYLGPLILATKNRPVRVKFTNSLGAGAAGNLFIPTDATYMGAGMGPGGFSYPQNRATLHLHGGNTPWISDGTPHQWITPAAETAKLNLGLSQRNVPDMPAPGAGSATFYWTNQQGGRLMFFHDHAYGITRLNVYAGEAAGYLLVDPAAENLLATATVPGTIGTTQDLAHVVPLVIQDKTFVPDSGAAGGQLAATDPTWDLTNFGGKGNLWFPHVYMPNQNPFDLSGANPFGRWDYGPWFWPPQNPATYVPGGQPYPCQSVAYPGQWLTCPGTPNPSGTPEGFMDTPVINGTAYPSLTVAPAAYRFQILSVGNDRTLNLGLYYAMDSATGAICKAGNAFTPTNCTEVSMVPAVQHPLVPPVTTPPTLPLCAQATATSGAMLALAALDVSGNPLNGTGLPAACWPTSWPTDGRDGGVPDPTTAGPPIIQIGTEGGLLPAPVAIPSTPMGYEYNRRSITVLNVFTHGLTLGPAERADVVVDFGSVPTGSVLIVYNDGPAPVPAFDPRSDYYTGDPDQTSTGGAPTTIPGYGPNTRTLMQINVSGNPNNTTPFSLPALANATTGLPSIFAATQDTPIVPEPAYPVGKGNASQGNYVRIQDNSFSFFTGGPVGGLTLLRAGAYTSAPTVSISGGGGGGAQATATIAPRSVFSVTVNIAGSGYTSAPAVSFTGGGGTGAAGTAVLRPTVVAGLTLNAGGSGYTSAPTVAIAPPGCVINGTTCIQALATATVRTNGQRNVNGLTLTNPGAGYASVPAVNFSGGGGSGAAATARLAATSVASVTLTSFGSGYTSAPTVNFSGGGGTGAGAFSTLAAGGLILTLTNGGTGYTSAPTVSFLGGIGAGALAVATAPAVPLQPKAIQELFTLDYGRMNATLGVELPFTNFLTQTTIPYGYVDPPTEIFKDGETQIWKITHNGVDTHFIHFHLFNVQVINRIGWDGAVKPPDANELAWKDTVRMNPLEDIVVAMRAMKQQNLPWKLPNSVRPLDVTAAVGASLPNEFTNIDPTNQPATVTNDLTNFGWEYVWHCHILGHEENDMMRAMSLVVAPDAPIIGTATRSGTGNKQQVALVWSAGSPNATGYTIQRATVTGGVPGAFANIGTTGANVTTFTDTTVGRGTTYVYRVIANNVVGYTQTYAAPAAGYPNVSVASLPSGNSNSVTTL